MGLRTVVIINNDHLNEIIEDPDFATNLYNSIRFQNSNFGAIDIASEGTSVGKVVHCSHSSVSVSLRLIDFNAHEIPE